LFEFLAEFLVLLEEGLFFLIEFGGSFFEGGVGGFGFVVAVKDEAEVDDGEALVGLGAEAREEEAEEEGGEKNFHDWDKIRNRGCSRH
jgi:hypothetical protein